MITCERCIYAPIPKIGLRWVKSKNLTDSAIPDKVREYARVILDSKKVETARYLLEDEKTVFLGYLKPMVLEYRLYCFNHTIFIQKKDYKKFGAHPEIFENYHFKSVDEIALPILDPITVDEARIESIKITNEELLLIHKYFSEKKGYLSYLLDKLQPNAVGCADIYVSSDDAVRLIYALLKILPSSRRIVPFATFYSDSRYIRWRATGEKQYYRYEYPETQDWSIKNIINEVLQAKSPNDLSKLYNIHAIFEESEKKGISIVQTILNYNYQFELDLSPDDKKRISLHIQRAKDFEKEGYFQEALNLYTEVLEKYSKLDENQRKEAVSGVIDIYIRTNKIEEFNTTIGKYYSNKSRVINQYLQDVRNEVFKKQEAKYIIKEQLSKQTVDIDLTTISILRSYFCEEIKKILESAEIINWLKNGSIKIGSLHNLSKQLEFEDTVFEKLTSGLQESEPQILSSILVEWGYKPEDTYKYFDTVVKNRKVSQARKDGLVTGLVDDLLSGQKPKSDIKGRRALYNAMRENLKSRLGDIFHELRARKAKFEYVSYTAYILDMTDALTNFNMERDLRQLLANHEQSLLYIYADQMTNCKYNILISTILENYLIKLNQTIKDVYVGGGVFKRETEERQPARPTELFKAMLNIGLIDKLNSLLTKYGREKDRSLFESILATVAKTIAQEEVVIK